MTDYHFVQRAQDMFSASILPGQTVQLDHMDYVMTISETWITDVMRVGRPIYDGIQFDDQ
jgi:hypothetical protein